MRVPGETWGGAGERWLTLRSYQLHPKIPWCEYTQYSTVLNYCRILPTLTNRKYCKLLTSY